MEFLTLTSFHHRLVPIDALKKLLHTSSREEKNMGPFATRRTFPQATLSETTKDVVQRTRPRIYLATEECCCVCRCNFRRYYGNSKRRISTENYIIYLRYLYQQECTWKISSGRSTWFLFRQKTYLNQNRVCGKCVTKIRITFEFMRCRGPYMSPYRHGIFVFEWAHGQWTSEMQRWTRERRHYITTSSHFLFC